MTRMPPRWWNGLATRHATPAYSEWSTFTAGVGARTGTSTVPCTQPLPLQAVPSPVSHVYGSPCGSSCVAPYVWFLLYGSRTAGAGMLQLQLQTPMGYVRRARGAIRTSSAI